MIYISNTRDSVSLGYPNLKKRVDEIQVVWIADETLSRVFDISSQWKQKTRSQQRSKNIKTYQGQRSSQPVTCGTGVNGLMSLRS